MDFTDDLWRNGVMGAYAGPTQSWFNSFATGGTITRVIQNNIIYRVHTFITGTGTLTVNRQFNVEYLVVAGGGGGGGGFQGGGGGAGGYLNSSTPVTTRTYTITVGAGGNGERVGGGTVTNGSNSVIQDIVVERGLTRQHYLVVLTRLGRVLRVEMEEYFHHMGVITLSVVAVVDHQVLDQTALIIRIQLLEELVLLILTLVRQQFMRLVEMAH
jgi:hypothetical protein